MNKKKKSYLFGLFAEYWVIFVLFFKGYILLKHRYKTNYGEIDLIFKKKNTIVAIEVKARTDASIQIGEVVSKYQLRRVRNTLFFFLNKNKKYLDFDFRVDIVLVLKNLKIKQLKAVEIL